MTDIRTVGVIGAGQMGSGIAHVCALAGYDVLLNDAAPERMAEHAATLLREEKGIPVTVWDVRIAKPLDPEMIADAEAHPRVRYAVAQYETGLPDHCAGIVTVAQALHWLDEDAFMREARRVLVPDGLLAAWCYGRPRIALAIDKIVDHFHDVIVGPYWPPERRHVEDQYRAIALPIDEYAVPPFEMAENWTLAQFGSYVRSWSSVARCLEARGEAPVVEFEAALAESWGEPKTRRRVRWPMHFRVGEIR